MYRFTRGFLYMTEIKKTIIYSNLYANGAYRPLYMWAIRRLPTVKFLYTISLVAFAYMIIQLLTISAPVGFLLKESLLLGLFVIYMFILLPNIKFYLDRENIKKTYGKVYEIVLDESGLKTGSHFITWIGKHRILECKYGIVIISYHKILAVLTKSSFTNTEYTMLKVWSGIS